MNIPKLSPSNRIREYKSYSNELRSKVVKAWLFSNKTHRELDEELLGFDRDLSRGYQSMGILHYLGLKADFHGLFINISEADAINELNSDNQDFSQIIFFIVGVDKFTDLRVLINEETRDIERSMKDDSNSRLARINAANSIPERMEVITFTYRRNADIVAEALMRANGFCEDCKVTAPFIRKTNNTPYLEVHHIKSLSEGGEDSLKNVIALCPNCHRKRHFG